VNFEGNPSSLTSGSISRLDRNHFEVLPIRDARRYTATASRRPVSSPAASVRCVRLSVELKEMFLDTVKRWLDAIDLPEAAFLQYANGSAVLNGDVRAEGPCRLLAQELRQRGSSDAAPPVFSPYPITDEASAIGVPASNVSDYAIVNDNGSLPSGRIADDVRAPVQHEGIVLTWRKCRHTVSFRITLMLEKDWQILFRHVPQHTPSTGFELNTTSAAGCSVASAGHTTTTRQWPIAYR
jgi:hypothetical protein